MNKIKKSNEIKLKWDGLYFDFLVNNKVVKKLSINTILKIFKNNQKFDSGILGPNIYRIIKTNKLTFVSVFITEQIRNIIYETGDCEYNDEGMENFNILIPNTLFILKFNTSKNQLIEEYVYAVKEKQLTHNSNLYFLPFGNVYRDGKICSGDASTFINITPSTSNRIINAFYSSPFNYDLDGDQSSYDYMKSLSKIKRFSYNALKKIDTYENIILKLTKNKR